MNPPETMNPPELEPDLTPEEKVNLTHTRAEHKLHETYFHVLGEYNGKLLLSGPWVQSDQDKKAFKKVLIDWCSRSGNTLSSSRIKSILEMLWKGFPYSDSEDIDQATELQLTPIGGTNVKTSDALKNLGTNQVFYWYTCSERILDYTKHEMTLDNDDKEDLARKIREVAENADGQLPYGFGPKNSSNGRPNINTDKRHIKTLMTLDEARDYLKLYAEKAVALGYESIDMKCTVIKGYEVVALIWGNRVSKLLTLTEVKVTEREREWSNGLILTHAERNKRLSRQIAQEEGFTGNIAI